MFLKNLKLVNFRNLKNSEITFSKINIFYGGNAQGKTSILEAIYFLFTGKSFRTFIDEELIKWNEEYSYLKGEVLWQEQDILIESALSIHGDKKIKINQKIVKKQKELTFLFPIVIFTQDEVFTIKDEPSARRFLLDRFISILHYPYNKILIDYQKALYQRNLLLKKFERLKDIKLWDNILIEKGSLILNYRLSVIKEMEENIKDISRNLLGEEELEIEYYSSIPIVDNDEKNIKNSFQKFLEESYEKDIEKKYTTIGPHRDDIIFYWRRNNTRYNLKKFGSGGERKMASLIWKLSEVKLLSEKRKEKAILLIDDLFSELDYEKQNIVWNAIKDFQIFLTSAYKLDIFKNFNIFEVNCGEVKYLGR